MIGVNVPRCVEDILAGTGLLDHIAQKRAVSQSHEPVIHAIAITLVKPDAAQNDQSPSERIAEILREARLNSLGSIRWKIR